MSIGNRELRLMESQVRTLTNDSGFRLNDFMAGLHVVLDVTLNAASAASIVLKIQGLDTVSGKWYDLLTSAAVTAAGTTVYKVFPSATAAANATANDIVPYKWRVLVTHADANPITYSVGASLIAS